MRAILTDVLIIGSGFGAAAAALRLAEAGYGVTIVEKGPDLDPRRDFRQTQDPKYLQRYLKGVSGRHVGMTYAEALGGGSGFYEMVSLRAPSIAFDQTDPDGRRLWPEGLSRAALDSYYDVAERMLNVEQIGIEQVPKTGQVFALMMNRLGYTCDRARYAVRGCVGSGFCVTGCIYGAKQSLHLNYLPQARAAGAVIVTGLEAVEIRAVDADRRRRATGPLTSFPHRYEVLCRSVSDPRRGRRYRARLVVLGGGTIGTGRLLLASQRHLPRLSRMIGRAIGFSGSVKVAGILPPELPDADMFTGRTHPGMISYHFLGTHGVTIAAAKALPISLVSSARLRLADDPREPSWWGEAGVELMRQCRHRMMVLFSLGLTAPTASMTLSEQGTVRVRLAMNDELRTYYRTTRELLDSILERNGCRLVRETLVRLDGTPRRDVYFSTTHQTGSCNMADSPDRGGSDANGEVFGYPGLYVADGAAVPGSLAVNPSLTILANAERIAAGILDRYAPRPRA